MSTDAPLRSSLWYRVAALRPRLAARARLARHHYRGERWYLLQDPATGRVQRFGPAARLLLAAMDGQRTVDELWQLAQRRLGEHAPTQDELIHLLGQLHACDLLSTDATADALQVFRRGQRQQAAQRRQRWANPLALRLPLLDPGAFLDRHAALWRRLWGPAGAVAWLALVLPTLLMLPPHWGELTGNLSDRVLAPDNLLLAALVFPLLKALHELGHATATRAFGGEVHDMGLMLLALMPMPYVDASGATVLPSRWQRALVGAAGMVVELFVAALAFHAWVALDPGVLRAVCFNIMLVAGVSTLVFNGNPLMRYDAYYMLADLAELPNLGQRAARYWGYLVQRHLLRLRDAVSPAHGAAERRWFLAYGLLSSAYRLWVAVSIALFIGTRYFFVGTLLALWAVAGAVGPPLLRALQQLRAQPALRERRRRILATAGAGLAMLALLAAGVPLPQRTLAEGVVWLPEQALLRAGADGFVTSVEVAPGTAVRAGQLLFSRHDPAALARVRQLQARVAELEASLGIALVTDRARAELLRGQWAAEAEALRRARERAEALPVRAAVDGRFMLGGARDPTGRWHRQGEVLGYVLGDQPTSVRVVIEQAQADLVAEAATTVALRLSEAPGEVIAGRIVRRVPAARDEAPSPALLAGGGGRLAADPADREGRRTLERLFQVDVAPQSPLPRLPAHGQRVHLRFEHPPAPAATQAWRALRRLFLRHFDA